MSTKPSYRSMPLDEDKEVSMSTHTPGKLAYRLIPGKRVWGGGRDDPEEYGLLGTEVGGADIARVNCEGNAAHLALCWNAHDGLVAALESIVAQCDGWRAGDPRGDELVLPGEATARAALATVRNET